MAFFKYEVRAEQVRIKFYLLATAEEFCKRNNIDFRYIYRIENKGAEAK